MVAIKHKKVTGRPIAVSDWDDNHVLTGTPGMTIVFDEAGEAVEVEPGTVDPNLYYTKEQVDAAIAAAIGGTPPAVTLAALSLSSSSFTVGTATSGTITGATSGSTITLSNAPTGFTINSGARTWAYSGAGEASSGNLTLTEALAGATNTPRVSSIGYTLADAPVGGLDPALSAPVLTLFTANLTYPPQFDVELDDTVVVGDTIRLQWDNNADFSSITGDATNVIDAGEASANAASFTGLSSITTGTHRFRARVERGASYSAWSNVITQGPDDQAPTLSLPTEGTIGATTASLGFTSDEAGTAYHVAVPSAEADPTNTQVKAGQKANGTAAPATDSGPAIAGVNSFDFTGLTAETSYKACTVVEDSAGNLSDVLTDTFTTGAANTSVAKLTPGTGNEDADGPGPLQDDGPNRNRYIDVSADGLSFIGNIDIGAPAMSRSTTPMPDEVHMEVTITQLGAVWFGIADAAQDFSSDYDTPGNNAQAGFSLEITANGLTTRGNGTAPHFNIGAANDAAAIAAGLIFGLDYKHSTRTLTITRKQGAAAPVTLVTDYVLTTNIPTTPTPFAGTNLGAGTVNFGAAAFAITSPYPGH